MDKLQRYSPYAEVDYDDDGTCAGATPIMEGDSEGRYVKYTDVLVALETILSKQAWLDDTCVELMEAFDLKE